jgi:hypothetical protein
VRAALPLPVGRRIDARLGEQALIDLAVGAFEGADEGALLLPALLHHFLALVVAGFARLNKGVGFSVLKDVVCHIGALLTNEMVRTREKPCGNPVYKH